MSALSPSARPAKSGKRYKMRRHAEATAEYLNRYGIQSVRYQWSVVEHDDGTYELWTIPRDKDAEALEAALDGALWSMKQAAIVLVENPPSTIAERRELLAALGEAREAMSDLQREVDAAKARTKLRLVQ